MKPLSFIFIFSFIISLNQANAANTYLQFQDPQDWWKNGQATIDSATLYVESQGMYVNHELYLTFSAKDYEYSVEDTFEVYMYFELPDDAVVYESVLWIGDSAVSAKLLDRWTANAIYEGIVNRRRDPSILYKNSQDDYELRVFPMAGNESRKVKISYLAPATVSNSNISCELPLDILRASKNNVNLELLVNKTSGLKPSLIEKPEAEFVEKSSSKGNVYSTLLNVGENNNLSVAFSSPIKDGIYFDVTGDESGGVYQLALLPSEILESADSEKILVVLDHKIQNSSNNIEDVLTSIKNQLLNNFNEKDSFNILYSDLSAQFISDDWLPCDSTSIAQTFESLESKVSTYTMLPALLAEGIKYIDTHNGKMILVSSSDDYGDYRVANQLYDDLYDLTDKLPAIFVADYCDINYKYYYQGGLSYRGNAYFYDILTRRTGGNLVDIRTNWSLTKTISNSFSALYGWINSVDIYTRSDGGFCFSRYNLTNIEQGVYVNQPIIQYGQFIGDFPFTVTFSGILNDEPITKTFTIDEPMTLVEDTLVDKMWASSHISSLENQNYYSNDIIKEIIENSLEYNVLSRYTAFLALEPGMSYEVSDDEEGDWQEPVVSDDLEKMDIDDADINLAPNPFTNNIRISVKVKSLENVTAQIFDLSGKVVKTFTLDNYDGNELLLEWNGEDNTGNLVKAGIYIVKIVTPEGVVTKKLIKQ